MFCKHKWEVLSETVTKSKFEIATQIENLKTVTLPWQLCCAKRKHIQIVTCSGCGKLKRFVEDI